MICEHDLPETLFANPIWHALRTTHRRFAIAAGAACRYPADVAPFGAVAEPSAAALRDLHSLLAAGESVWLIGQSDSSLPDLVVSNTLECLQMVLPLDVAPPPANPEVAPLSAADAPAMVALTDRAFPGYFRGKTCEMGSYYGVRRGGELIAMGGERLMLDGYSEISGLCTHPAHRGKGLAAGIICQLVQNHRRDGLVSWLHVGTENAPAIQIYLRMGFKVSRTVRLQRMSRADAA